jgi:membrane associated rhomboid family serine protease
MNNFYEFAAKRKKRFFLDWSVTWQLVFVNVLFFIVTEILILTNLVPIDYLALKPKLILEKYYLWTFVTSMFMHSGIFHLFVNMISLLFIGNLLEKILGKRRYFWIYLLSGLFAGIFFVLSSLIFSGDYSLFAVGASGALFGLIGVLIFLTPNLPVYIFFIPIPIKIKYAAPGLLVLLWLISLFGNVPIGNTAHLGGLLIGVIYGLILRYKFPKKVKYINQKFS